MRSMMAFPLLVLFLAGCDKKPEATTPPNGIKLAPSSPNAAPTPAGPRGAEPKPDADNQPQVAGEINDVCPVTGDTVDPKFTATYQGRTIAFCCEHCLREFKDADENGKAEIAAKAK